VVFHIVTEGETVQDRSTVLQVLRSGRVIVLVHLMLLHSSNFSIQVL